MEFCFDVEGVGAVEVDVVVVCGCQVRRGLAGDWVAVGAQRVERVAEVSRGLPSSLVLGQGHAPTRDLTADEGVSLWLNRRGLTGPSTIVVLDPAKGPCDDRSLAHPVSGPG